MQNAEVIRLRREYDALILVADGLVEMIYGREACNVISFARMAEQARAAARSLAALIERMIYEERPAPVRRKASVFEKIGKVVKAVVAALLW